MEFTAKQIADFINGRVEGDVNAAVHTFAKIEEGQPGAISFLSNPKYTQYLYDTKSTIVLVNEDLELENRELTDNLDTRSQTGALPVHIDYTFKVEQMEYAKQGYVVKEEEIGGLDRGRFDVPDRKFLDMLLENGLGRDAAIRKILYIHKFYYKVSLGIDFSKMMYAFQDGRVLFYGARFKKLHDISSEMQPE